jgi:hypothetical protein
MGTRRIVWRTVALGLVALVAAGGASAQTAQDAGKDAAPVASGQVAPWHTLAGPERGFTAEMPAAPAHSAIELHTAAGSPYTMHQYTLEQDKVAYVVQTVTYPEDVRVSSPRVNLQGGLDNVARSMEGGKWASIGWLTHQGSTAVDAVGERDGHAIRSFSVMKGRQVFTLTYAGPAGSARSPEADRFIASLRIGP